MQNNICRYRLAKSWNITYFITSIFFSNRIKIHNENPSGIRCNKRIPRKDGQAQRDGIILRLNKFRCSCPMAPEVAGAALCHCTRGHEKACRSRAFGKPVEVEIAESWLRGGYDCAIKLKMSFRMGVLSP